MRVFKQVEKVEQAITKAGSIAALSRKIGVTETTIRRWLGNEHMRRASIAKLNTFLGG